MELIIILAVVALLLFTKGKRATTAGVGSAPLPGSNSGNSGLDMMSEAIARAEGFYKAGSLAQRTNNPGDLGTYGSKVGSYDSPSDGWAALNSWLTRHAAANPTWDFYDTSRYYLTGDTMGAAGPGQNPDTYAEGIASYLGIDPLQPVSSVLGG